MPWSSVRSRYSERSAHSERSGWARRTISAPLSQPWGRHLLPSIQSSHPAGLSAVRAGHQGNNETQAETTCRRHPVHAGKPQMRSLGARDRIQPQEPRVKRGRARLQGMRGRRCLMNVRNAILLRAPCRCTTFRPASRSTNSPRPSWSANDAVGRGSFQWISSMNVRNAIAGDAAHEQPA
jgi:hypothetical protein